MVRGSSKTKNPADIPPYPQELLLINATSEMSGDRVLCTSAGLAQFAVAIAQALPLAVVSCTYLDLYRANLAAGHWADPPSNLRIECAADLDSSEADVVAFPFSAGGESELARDFIQAGHERLRRGGRMYVSTENRRDTWLRDLLGGIFRKLERRPSSKGVLYVGTKGDPLKKIKNYSCEFAFNDRGRLIQGFSRPGVFSHRKLDTGARKLIDEMQIDAGARVLDIGCGSGGVALAAACRGESVAVHAVDSNVRAVACAARGAVLNELPNVTTELNAIGDYADSGKYDLALANPPYYSDFKIAGHFLTAGHDALRAGGKLLVVTKRPDWYQENMPQLFENVTVAERKSYFIVRGVRRGAERAETGSTFAVAHRAR